MDLFCVFVFSSYGKSCRFRWATRHVCVVSGEVGRTAGIARLCCWNSWSQAQAAALRGALHGSCASAAASAAPAGGFDSGSPWNWRASRRVRELQEDRGEVGAEKTGAL